MQRLRGTTPRASSCSERFWPSPARRRSAGAWRRGGEGSRIGGRSGALVVGGPSAGLAWSYSLALWLVAILEKKVRNATRGSCFLSSDLSIKAAPRAGGRGQ